jgi:hypothetical protein
MEHHANAVPSSVAGFAGQTLGRVLVRPGNAQRLDCARFIAAFSTPTQTLAF